MKMINLGCGNRFHESWINLDFNSHSENIIKYNLLEKLPFQDNDVDVIYTSHVLEHFSKCDAPKFLEECYRILKPNGIIRIIVPDLEQLIKNYLTFLNAAKQGNTEAQEKYEWTMIEIFDQMVRNYPGGEMFNYWKQNPMPQEEFIIQRLGSEVKNSLNILRQNPNIKPDKNCTKVNSEEIGKFRLSGEVHQWMYDEYSLGDRLNNCGFRDIKKVNANESKIPNFNSFFLDCEQNGDVRKPDSLFMEAIK